MKTFQRPPDDDWSKATLEQLEYWSAERHQMAAGDYVFMAGARAEKYTRGYNDQLKLIAERLNADIQLHRERLSTDEKHHKLQNRIARSSMWAAIGSAVSAIILAGLVGFQVYSELAV